MIKHYTLKALEKAINHALNLDPASKERLLKLNGKIVEMIISPLGVHFFLSFEGPTLKLYSHTSKTPDTIIHSSPLGLIRLSLLPASKVRSLFNDSIRLTGDATLGQDVKALFDELDIDWEGHLAHFTGDVVAHQVGRVVRSGMRWGQDTQKAVADNLNEYLHEELTLLPSREELEDFFKDVDALVLKTERLQAHYNQLRARYEAD